MGLSLTYVITWHIASSEQANGWSEVKSLSRVRLFATPWTIASQAPLSMGFFQAIVLEWIAISFSKGSLQPRDQTQVSCITGGFFNSWATREGFDKCIVTGIHHYNITQSSSTALKIPCAPPIPPSFLPTSTQTPSNHWSFSYLHRFAFSRMSCSRDGTVCSL